MTTMQQLRDKLMETSNTSNYVQPSKSNLLDAEIAEFKEYEPITTIRPTRPTFFFKKRIKPAVGCLGQYMKQSRTNLLDVGRPKEN